MYLKILYVTCIKQVVLILHTYFYCHLLCWFMLLFYRCVTCLNCGSSAPGFGCEWKNNYTQCGPCNSKLYCPACEKNYQEGELIIQCVQCERWLHAPCDGIRSEDDAERAADYGYHCLFCRPKTGQYGPCMYRIIVLNQKYNINISKSKINDLILHLFQRLITF